MSKRLVSRGREREIPFDKLRAGSQLRSGAPWAMTGIRGGSGDARDKRPTPCLRNRGDRWVSHRPLSRTIRRGRDSRAVARAGVSRSRGRELLDAVVAAVGDVDVAGRVDRHADGRLNCPSPLPALPHWSR